MDYNNRKSKFQEKRSLEDTKDLEFINHKNNFPVTIKETTHKIHNAINSLASSPMKTPKTNIEFSQELKQVIQERNLLTKRTKKHVFDVLDEIEVTRKVEGVLRKKENAVFEIITSEKSYVKQLETIINFFMKPVKEKKLLDSSDFEIIFGNIQTIYSVNEALLKELYKGSTNIANAFLKISPYFKMYASYAMGFRNILHFLERCPIRNPEFYKFMEMQETRPEVQNRLSALLIAPIQRIPRYKLLLQQLYDLTSPSDKNFDSISLCLARIEEAAEHINKVIEEQENTQRLLEVQRCLKNNEPSIITPGRSLLKEGILLKFDGNVGPSEKFYVILLNDLLLFCKMKNSTPKPNSLKCKRIFPLNKCTITENVEKGCFEIHCQEQDLILYDRTVSVTKQWISSIKYAIENCLEKRKTLRKESSARRPVKRKDISEYNDPGLSPGVPLKRRRQAIEDEKPTERHMLSNYAKSLKTSHHINKLPSEQLSQERTKLSEASTSINDESSSQPNSNTEVFVFGQDNSNTSFTFRLTNLMTNIGSSLANMFKFRR